MIRIIKSTFLVLVLLNFTGCAQLDALLGGTGGAAALTTQEIGLGLKEALNLGIGKGADNVSKQDGFFKNQAIKILFPPEVQKVQTKLENIGLGSLTDNFVEKMNRAAEAAAPKAKALFWDAIQQLTIEDIMAIYQGNDDAATRYFESKMSTPLVNSMLPEVQQSMAEVGAVRSYDQLVRSMGPAGALLPDYKTQLTNHVLQLGTGAIFNYLAEEEAAIRQDPVKRTTQLLQRVFGAVY